MTNCFGLKQLVVAGIYNPKKHKTTLLFFV